MVHMAFYLVYDRCGHLRDEYKLTSNGISESVYTRFPARFFHVVSLKLNRLKSLELCCNLRRDQSKKCSKNCGLILQSMMVYDHIPSLWYCASPE